jgi:hypothetical protein
LAIDLGVHVHARGEDSPQVIKANHFVLGEILHCLDVGQNFWTEDVIQQVEMFPGFLIFIDFAKLFETVPPIVEGMERGLESQQFQLRIKTLKTFECAIEHFSNQRALDSD